VEPCRDWTSVLTATNSTPVMPASTMRLTALTPPPPTPTTRSTGAPANAGSGSAGAHERTSGSWISGSRATGRSMMSSGMSAENACRSRSCGDGTRGSSRGGSGAGAGAASSVFLKRSAKGPSRMLARLPVAMGQHLLREVAIRLRGLPGRIVLEHGHPLHGSLCETHGLADARCEHTIAEVLLQDLDRLLRVQRPRVDQRRQDPLDLDVGVQVLADHVQRVLELDEPAHGEVLALHGDDHLVRRRQRVDRQQPETRGRVDQ